MELIGTKVLLSIDEPWNLSKTVAGTIIKQYLIDQKTYLLIKENSLPEMYVVSNRYVGEDAKDVILGRMIIVGIALADKDILSSDDSTFFTHLKYIARGSIELDYSPEK